MSTLAMEGRDLAEQMHALLRALDRMPSGREAMEALRHKAEALRLRCAQLMEKGCDARDEAVASAIQALAPLASSLDELCQTLKEGVPDKAAFAAFKAGAAPRYEAFVSRLRAMRVEVPTLRPQNMVRSLFHMSSALVAAVSIEVLPWGMVFGIAVAFFLFSWTMELGRRRFESFRRFSMVLFGKMIHPHEHHRINSATWYATALLPIWLLFGQVPCLLAVLVLGFGDPAAAFVGRRWGRIRLLGGRSLEGSLGFVGASLLISMLALAFHPELSWSLRWSVAAVAAVSGAIAEAISGRVDDNLSIPLVVAAACAAVLGGVAGA